MKERSPTNFQFIIDFLRSKREETPRTLIFFASHADLVEAYSYITHHVGQEVGDPKPMVSMYHSVTAEEIKSALIKDMKDFNGYTRLILCTSSLSMGVDMADVKYVIHYGVPCTTDDFLQETGRAGREDGSKCHSLVINYPHSVSGRPVSKTMRKFNKRVLKTCRRNIILSDYNQKDVKQNPCCDICTEVLGPYDFSIPGETSAQSSVTSPSRSAYSADTEIPDPSSSD